MKRQAPALPAATLLWLLLSLALVFAPHALRQPVWSSAAVVAFGLWRWAAERGRLPLPGTLLRVALALAVGAGIYLSFGRLFGREAGVAWLSVLAALKLLESRDQRDGVTLMFLAYFLVITNFLFTQTIPTALYMLVTVLVITATLVALQRRGTPLPARLRLGIAAKLLLPALPIMALLFVLFPRIAGPLWGMPNDAYSGVTGLDNSMAPGSISQLSQSNAVAMRVQFNGTPPPKELRYWRGPVLWHYNGREWTEGFSGAGEAPQAVIPEGPAVSYTVTLEPTNHRWLFALDLPASGPAGATPRGDFEIRVAEPVRSRLRYRMLSYPRYRTGLELDAATRHRALQLPAHTAPRARSLAERWRAENPAPEAIVRRALAMFHDQGFVYTLNPPRLTRDPVDQFLFGTRRGFCEHYAGAFVVLMRAAGVPARVVIGYQGGEVNPLDGYVVVRQADAHAWAEVWLPQRGWTRVDPTAAVAEARIDGGIQAALPDAPGLPAVLRTRNNLLRGLYDAMDAVNNAWNQWVLAYGPGQQQAFLSRFGLGSWRNMALALLATVGLVLALTALLLLRRRRGKNHDPVSELYNRFCRKLERVGLARQPHEGPRHFARRIALLRPDLARQVKGVTSLYIRLQYGREAPPGWEQVLRRRVRDFRPSRAPR